MQAFLDLLRAGTAAVKDLTHLPSISASPAAAQQQAAAAAVAGLRGSSAVTEQSCVTAAGGTGSSQPGAVLVQSADGGSSDAAAAFEQQLALLKASVLASVRVLGVRVGTTAELCEAVAAVLGAVAEEMQVSKAAHLHSPRRGLSSAGAAASTAGARAASPFAARAGTPVAGAEDGVHDAGAATDEVSAAAGAVMALECAAAATEAYMQQQQQQQGPGAGGCALAGGVLPPGLVSAALPLLAGGPGVVRRAVQRILLTLLPAATNVSVCRLAPRVPWVA